MRSVRYKSTLPDDPWTHFTKPAALPYSHRAVLANLLARLEAPDADSLREAEMDAHRIRLAHAILTNPHRTRHREVSPNKDPNEHHWWCCAYPGWAVVGGGRGYYHLRHFLHPTGSWSLETECCDTFLQDAINNVSVLPGNQTVLTVYPDPRDCLPPAEDDDPHRPSDDGDLGVSE